jgi:hypothetical protein
MAETTDIQVRRQALVQAINARDVETIGTFIHPEFKALMEVAGRGQFWRRDQLLQQVKVMFDSLSEFEETVVIEKIEVSGDIAKLSTLRTDRGKMRIWFFPIERTDSALQLETWKLEDGQWMLIEAQIQPHQPPDLPRTAPAPTAGEETLPTAVDETGPSRDTLPGRPE